MTPKSHIDQLIGDFFQLFTTPESGTLKLDKIYDLCIPEAVIIKNVEGKTETYNLKSFIEPREKLLNSGELINFSERETWEQTQIFGHIAQRFCVYVKAGVLNGKAFNAKGMKTFQFILTANGWKISAMAWDDESDSLKIEDKG